jgi:hypothetical protein
VSEGLGNGAFEVSVPQNIDVAEGDIVRLQTSETLVLGVVVSVTNVPTDISKIVRYRSPINPSEIDFVRILSNETKP